MIGYSVIVIKNNLLNFVKSNRLLTGSAASAVARITTVAALVVTTAIATRVMSSEEFGLWAIFVSFIYISANFDLGYRYSMGNRLAAFVARAGGKTNNEQRELYLSIFLFQLYLGLIGAAVAIVAVPFFSWADILKIKEFSIVQNIDFYIITVLVSLFLSLPFMLMGSGFFAFQEINLVCSLSAAQSLIQLFIFWVSSRFLSFKGILFLYFLAYVLGSIVLTMVFFWKRKWSFSWIPLPTQIRYVTSLFQQSFTFFVLSLSSSIISAVSTILAGTVAGLSVAGNFDLVKKIFGLLTTLHLALLAPLAPAYTQSAQLGNWEWINQKLSFCLQKVWTMLFLGVGGLIYVFHPFVLKLWTGRDLSDYRLAGLLALVAVLSGWGNTYSVVLNSLGLVKWQAIFVVSFAPLFIFLPLFIGKYWSITGVAVGTLLCMLPGTIIWPIYTRYALRAKLLKV